MMRKYTFAMTSVWWALFVSPVSAQVPGFERMAAVEAGLDSFFVRAVVKINVSGKTPVIKDGVNTCVSQGTGFLVSANHVLTAEHVYALKPECGERIILLQSTEYKLNVLASVVAAKDDVGLLKVDVAFPAEMCALIVNPKIVGREIVRYGIPGEFDELPAATYSKLGSKEGGQFSPYVLVSPAFAEKGESGGPVIQTFHVVGMTRARVAKYPAHSIMIPGSIIRALLDGSGFQPTRICNPFLVEMKQADLGSVDFFSNLSGQPKNVEARVTIDRRMIPLGSRISPELIQSYLPKSTDPAVSIVWDNGGATIRVGFGSPTEYLQAMDKVYRGANDVLQGFQQKLWTAYKLEKSGGESAQVVAHASKGSQASGSVAPTRPTGRIMAAAVSPIERQISVRDGVALQRALCAPETGSFDEATRYQLRNFKIASLYPNPPSALDERVTTDADLSRLRLAQKLYPDCRVSGFQNGFEVGLFTRFGQSKIRSDLKMAMETAGLMVPKGLDAIDSKVADASIREVIPKLRAVYGLPGPAEFDRAFYDSLLKNLER